MNSCLKKGRPVQDYCCQCCECTGECGPKQSGGPQNTPVPVKAARDDHKSRNLHTTHRPQQVRDDAQRCPDW